MERCWFVLRQRDYPAPDVDKMRKGEDTSPLCLGHIIPGLKQLDQVVNEEGVEPFPRSMQIGITKAIDFRWDLTKERVVAPSAGAAVPIAAAMGITLKADAGVAFRRSTQNFWHFESLDSITIRPTKSYINDCLESPLVAGYVEKKKILGNWSIFMVTGLMVARQAKLELTEIEERALNTEFGVELFESVAVHQGLKLSKNDGLSMSATSTSDFVWAIRLAKISKNGFQTDWSMKTQSAGSTFSNDLIDVDVRRVLIDEGLDGIEVIEDEAANLAFCL